MVIAPAFFSTNLVFGRNVNASVDPFLLAFMRWGMVAIILAPFVWHERKAALPIVKQHWRLLVVLGFCGMWISGAIVYLALRHTTATNGTLIYTTSPVMIILIEAAFLGRAIGKREIFGVALAFIGAALIILRGDLASLFSLTFNPGDLMILAAALSWAVYTMLQRQKAFAPLSNMALFGLAASFGALTLAPAVGFITLRGTMQWPDATAWPSIAGIVVFSSLLAFSSFQYGVRRLGASVAGIFMYLLPPYGVGMAALVLGERIEAYHLKGIALVLAGIILATFPVKLLKRFRNQPS